MNNKKMKPFLFSDVFIHKRGERITEAEMVEGEITYISSTKNNNGINNYINPPEYMTRHKNKMTLSNSGSICYLFYHDYEFVASDHVTVIWIKDEEIELTKEISLFLKPIFESMRYKYNFGREISNARLIKEKILLPVTEKDKPDWLYMESFIREAFDTVVFNKVITSETSHKDVNYEGWKDFRFDEIFEINRGDSEYLKNMNRGIYPYVSATAKNHGISDFVDKYNRTENCIVLNYDGSVGESFYHDQPFFASEKVVTLDLKKGNLNKYVALFIITMIKQEKFRYSYGMKWSVETRMKKSIIKLPARKLEDGEYTPNLEYMESFIKSLPYAEKL